tara:strand:+ start:1266 stop:1451 length:186 start_codon:yes stop_codon:yes gene_type:complete
MKKKKSIIDKLRKQLKVIKTNTNIKEKKVIEKIILPNIKNEKEIIEDKFYNLDDYYNLPIK